MNNGVFSSNVFLLNLDIKKNNFRLYTLFHIGEWLYIYVNVKSYLPDSSTMECFGLFSFFSNEYICHCPWLQFLF